MISVRHVSKRFDGQSAYAVKDVSLEVAQGETLVLLGSSGSGKTTLLRMINRLTELTEGEILVGGRSVYEQDPIELRRSIGYVFQGIGLFPHLNIADNVSIVLRLLGVPAKQRDHRARELLELVELAPDLYARRFPDELSGGQRQRVGVARALAADPAILLMDEPFGALDGLTRDTLQRELLQLKQRLPKTIVFVTHDLFEALTLGDRIAVMHQGVLQQVGTANEILARPATDFVRELFEKPAKQLAAFGERL